jgi:hypothetical protein
MGTEYHFTTATEEQLNTILAGHDIGSSAPVPAWETLPRSNSSIGVVYTKRPELAGVIQPVVLIVNDNDVRRLYARFATLRTDFSPLSSWCHVLSPDRFRAIDDLTREADLGGLQAAWTGLAIAEALLSTEKKLPNLLVTSCLATQTFAIARAKALWGVSVNALLDIYDTSRRIFKTPAPETRGIRQRSALTPVWSSLSMLSGSESNTEFRGVVEALRALTRARLDKDPQEARHLASPLLGVCQEGEWFSNLEDLTPEKRLSLFDRLVAAINESGADRFSLRRTALSLLAGYLATVAAGGSPTLSLVEATSRRWPEITAWAYVIGGVGEAVYWTSSFDGLGRLVAREMMRPLRLNDAPTCDCSVAEAEVLVDTKLRDSLVHLRIKQARTGTVALLPGVNVTVSLEEPASREIGKDEYARQKGRELNAYNFAERDSITPLVEALWPYIRTRVQDLLGDAGLDLYTDRGSGKRRLPAQPKLPLPEPKK